jgi:uncharacterized protein YcaQ
MPEPTLDDLRRYAVTRSLFKPTTLRRATERLGFVQADPIRAPARAQDLTLRHRVAGYRAGDLEQRYARLDIEEDFFVNYGFLRRRDWALMHPRASGIAWDRATQRRAKAVLAFVQQRGPVHPRDVDAAFAHGSVTNYWGSSSNATTHLLDAMHYRGLLRVVRRDRGIRVYAAHEHEKRRRDAATRQQTVDALVDIAVNAYAPLPAPSLVYLVRRLRGAVPHLAAELPDALRRARARLGGSRLEGLDWYWPANEDPLASRGEATDTVRLLAPFDPVVWDRRRFELFWGWPYRFEAYTPTARRRWGYYALPLLWGDRVIGWANCSVASGRLEAESGYVDKSAARDPRQRRALEEEVERLKTFLGV